MKRLFYVLALLLLAATAQGGVIQKLIDEGVLVLAHFYQSGTMLDWSGNSNHGTATNITWDKDGAQFPTATSKITVADSPELQLTEGTLIIYSVGGFMSQDNDEFLIYKQDAGGTNYSFYLYSTPRIYFWDGAVASRTNTNITGKHCIGITFNNGDKPEGFVDGVSVAPFDLASIISVNNADITIGNNFAGGFPFHSTLSAALIVNRKLTATEHAALYAELDSMQWPTKSWGWARGTYGPELITNGDMEAVGTGAWTPGAGATLTKEVGNVLAGSQVLRIAHGGTNYPYAAQNITSMISGRKYRITGWARGNGGVVYPALYLTGPGQFWTGTTANQWQRIDIPIVADSGYLIMHARTTVAGYAEFDNISVREVIVPETRFTSDWGAYASGVTTASGPLVNTPFQVSTGSFRMITDTINGETVKAIECVTDGIIYLDENLLHQGAEQRSYGTWEWWIYRHGAAQNIGFISDASSANGYLVTLTIDNLYLQILTGGVPTILDSDTSGAYTPDAWYKSKITRRQRDGLLNVFVGDALTLSKADTTHTTSTILGFDIDAGDKISWSSRKGEYSISKRDGCTP